MTAHTGFALVSPTQPAALVIDVAAALAAFDEAVPRFVREKRATATRDGYTRALGVYRVHCADRRLSPFGGDAVQSYNDAQRQQWQVGDLAADTVRLRLSVVRAFLAWAYDYGLTAIPPGRLKRWLHLPPARQLSPRDVLSADEAKALIDAARDTRDRLLIRVMLGAGLRVSEALAMRPIDLWRDDGRAWLHVRPSKGEKERDVEIDLALHRDLVRWARDRRLDHEDLLWTLDPGTAWRMVQRTAAKAGITKAITPHSLRHTHAHHLRLGGMPLEVLSARLGHASIETTKTYTRPAEMAQAMALPTLPWAVV
jgi:site-specific recombinase XerD